MLDPTLLTGIGVAGPWVICVAVIVSVLMGFASGKFRTKGELDREISRADKATAQVDKMTASDIHRQEQFDQLSVQLKGLMDIVGRVLVDRATNT